MRSNIGSYSVNVNHLLDFWASAATRDKGLSLSFISNAGKFVIGVEHNGNSSAFLKIVVEQRSSITPTDDMQSTVGAPIRTHLFRLNSEFANYVLAAKHKPNIELHLPGQNDFTVWMKQGYTR